VTATFLVTCKYSISTSFIYHQLFLVNNSIFGLVKCNHYLSPNFHWQTVVYCDFGIVINCTVRNMLSKEKKNKCIYQIKTTKKHCRAVTFLQQLYVCVVMKHDKLTFAKGSFESHCLWHLELDLNRTTKGGLLTQSVTKNHKSFHFSQI